MISMYDHTGDHPLKCPNGYDKDCALPMMTSMFWLGTPNFDMANSFPHLSEITKAIIND